GAAAAARGADRGDARFVAVGRASGSDAARARRGRGAARRRATTAGPQARRAPRGRPVKLLVTGATGFLGSTLVPMLVEAGHEVRILVRSPLSLAGVETVRGDVLDKDSITKALQGREGLYHLAGLVSRDPADARKMYELH